MQRRQQYFTFLYWAASAGSLEPRTFENQLASHASRRLEWQYRNFCCCIQDYLFMYLRLQGGPAKVRQTYIFMVTFECIGKIQ